MEIRSARQEPPELPLPARPSPARLLLVRHGQSTWNSEHRIQGQLDPMRPRPSESGVCPHREKTSVSGATRGWIEARSPARTLVTLRAISTTRPLNSCPRAGGALACVSGCGSTRMKIGLARYSCRSVPQMPQEPSRTRTSRGPGRPGSRKLSTRRSRRPWKRSAFTRHSPDKQRNRRR